MENRVKEKREPHGECLENLLERGTLMRCHVSKM